MTDLDELAGMLEPDPGPPSLTGALGKPGPRIVNPVIARRNRNNRTRGRSTSRDLADYLGIQNVEGLNWPWDVQSNTLRIQSKRDALTRGPLARLALIDYIPSGDFLRGLFLVGPRQKLTTGSVTFRLQEWTEWYGWDLPGVLTTCGVTGLITVALPAFRDLYDGRAKAA